MVADRCYFVTHTRVGKRRYSFAREPGGGSRNLPPYAPSFVGADLRHSNAGRALGCERLTKAHGDRATTRYTDPRPDQN
jgi:hypothetical protein